MTTKPQYDFVENINQKNDVFCFDVGDTLSLSAEVWTLPNHSHVIDARQEIVNYCMEKYSKRNPWWSFWLLASHKILQPDNRIVRYHRFWASMQKRGMPFPSMIPEFEEGLRVYSDGVRFYGARKINQKQISVVDQVLRSETGVIVAGDEVSLNPVISILSSNGWDIGKTSVSAKLLDIICAAGGLVLEIFGEFDDSEVGVVGIGKREILLET